MDKRTSTLSTCVTPELEIAGKALAKGDGMTVSELLCHLLEEYVERKRSLYLGLSQVFGDSPDLPSQEE